jgi:ABC-2 type transport system permease protein
MIARNVESAVALLVMPLVVVALATPLLSPLARERDLGSTGAVLTVPGILVTFGLVAVGFVASSVFREHGWGTWTRLRSVGAPPWSLLVGKLGPHSLLLLGQAVVMLLVARVGFGLPALDAPVAAALLSLAWVACLIAIAAVLVSYATDIQQSYLFSNMGSLVLAGLGGALIPLELFPEPLRTLARGLPTYWATRGYRDLVLGHGLDTVWAPVAVLAVMTAVLAAVAARRFRFDDDKVV